MNLYYPIRIQISLKEVRSQPFPKEIFIFPIHHFGLLDFLALDGYLVFTTKVAQVIASNKKCDHFPVFIKIDVFVCFHALYN